MRKLFFPLIFIFLFHLPLFSQSRNESHSIYPLIPFLNSRDVLFKQYQEDVEDASKAFASRKDVPLNFYSYRVKKEDSIFSIASRSSLRYDSLASLNSLENSFSLKEGSLITLPVSNGVYIADLPQTPIDFLLRRQYAGLLFSDQASEKNYRSPVACFVNGKKYYFIPDGKFSPEVRAFFVNTAMYLPVESSVLSSEFGMRVSPISGKWKMHHGIDLACPLGSEVFACRSGTVLSVTEMDSVYGNYIILSHEGGMTSLYAHLKDFSVKKGDIVAGGRVIGHVGLTGLTTGPHLHFEIRNNGRAEDPAKYFDK